MAHLSPATNQPDQTELDWEGSFELLRLINANSNQLGWSGAHHDSSCPSGSDNLLRSTHIRYLCVNYVTSCCYFYAGGVHRFRDVGSKVRLLVFNGQMFTVGDADVNPDQRCWRSHERVRGCGTHVWLKGPSCPTLGRHYTASQRRSWVGSQKHPLPGNTLALQIHLLGQRQNVHARTCSPWVSSSVRAVEGK